MIAWMILIGAAPAFLFFLGRRCILQGVVVVVVSILLVSVIAGLVGTILQGVFLAFCYGLSEEAVRSSIAARSFPRAPAIALAAIVGGTYGLAEVLLSLTLEPVIIRRHGLFGQSFAAYYQAVGGTPINLLSTVFITLMRSVIHFLFFYIAFKSFISKNWLIWLSVLTAHGLANVAILAVNQSVMLMAIHNGVLALVLGSLAWLMNARPRSSRPATSPARAPD